MFCGCYVFFFLVEVWDFRVVVVVRGVFESILMDFLIILLLLYMEMVLLVLKSKNMGRVLMIIYILC